MPAKRQALNQALTLFSWDQETEAPIASVELTAKSVGILSKELFELINESRIMSGCYLPVIAIPQGSPSESIFQNILVDDKKGYGMNYQEFINSF